MIIIIQKIPVLFWEIVENILYLFLLFVTVITAFFVNFVENVKSVFSNFSFKVNYFLNINNFYTKNLKLSPVKIKANNSQAPPRYFK